VRQHRREDRCLGERAAALADGELGANARDAALAHLVHCDGCRDDVAGQRRLKARLAELAEPPLPPGLLERLTATSAVSSKELGLLSDQPVPVHRHRVHLPMKSRRRPGRFGRVHHERPYGRSRRSVRYVIGGGVSVLALGVSAFALGGGGQSAPTVVPQVDNFTFEQAQTSVEVPFVTAPNAVTFKRVLVGARP
jgi:hypothetical protein